MAEFDRLRRQCLGRRLSRMLVDQGCSGRGVFSYLVDEMGLSEAEATLIVNEATSVVPHRR